jgi:RNA polymerase sigma factor (sigma-70 family)
VTREAVTVGGHVDQVDPAAASLDAFCRREFGRIVGLLTLYCGNNDVATDLAQEALARACVHWRRVRGMESPEAWLSRVAINLANSRFRRLKAERRANEHVLGRPDSRVEADHATALTVRLAVAGLPRRQRTAIVLRYFSDLSVAQTAELMHCGENTVKKLSARGLAHLRTRLDVDLDDGSPE